MEWRDQGTVLSVRKHGENSVILEAFTEMHGRHAGVVRGGTGRRLSPILQPGAQLDLRWRARIEEQLGTFAVEPVKSRAADIMNDRLALAGLNAVTGLLSFVLPDRAPYPALYHSTQMVLDMLGTSEHWPLAYLRWELAVLEDMGFGLDLSRCAATGVTHGLVYVSPKSGSAVSLKGAGQWADRLLPLPPCLMGKPPEKLAETLAEIAVGLSTTGYFFEHKLRPAMGSREMPAARARLIALLKR
jgi:DNA repair protein RecO (recombination protein O)